MNRIIFSISVFFIVSSSFAQKQFAYQVECVFVENVGSVTIKVWNTKLGKKYTSEQSRKDAIDAILYTGVPGNNNCITQKPILATQESIESFSKIEKEFFSKDGGWSNYTREATTATSTPENIPKRSWKVYRVSVSKNLLTKYLEDKNIIKSLNSGF